MERFKRVKGQSPGLQTQGPPQRCCSLAGNARDELPRKGNRTPRVAGIRIREGWGVIGEGGSEGKSAALARSSRPTTE
ncbi:hypothetical protein chiPu_0025334, partial [Chiloscyllium punctatum]|nr:hypothetical protein [Chiloscyllium punctatum]